MPEFIAINEQRAEFYWWMSSLFANELTQDNLNDYHSDKMQNYLDMLAMTEEFIAPINAFSHALKKQQTRLDAQLELAADFCGLFLSTPKSGALPYASMYIGVSGLLNDKPAQEMGQWLNKYAMLPRKEFNEPFDHLAVLLDFMGNLIILANKETEEEKQEAFMQEQLVFLEKMLISWLPLFQKRLNEVDSYGFYRAAGLLLSQFIALDCLFLKGQ